MLRVILVDDHPVVRAGLKTLLAGDDQIDVVAEASSGSEAVAKAGAFRPDVVLMDLRMGPGVDGADATREIVAVDDPPKVVILTTFETDTDILRAVEAGASGYLLKDSPPDKILHAVHAASRGETVLGEQVAGRLLTRLRTPQAELSGREIEVLKLVSQGMSNRNIAKTMFVSEATVKSHLVHVFTKLDVDSRTAAVAAARERGLIS
ncbi:response regulator [Spelaeicoccus albus]|uniref:DNA-binding NarL/FixJ family response regulator n=1 Tax=Spelaeicoccus albus TaxID=1280376 RepID=A0A7Z0D2R7_9MICO|nr:response regulator transcription factor [Spelaeicoccus albus]NYI67798.1 DNA-binding NarL/FixJ family response regulator [Spelaeicoccus albus]